MKSNESFSAYHFRTGLLADLSGSEFPTRLHAMVGNGSMVLNHKSTYFVYVYSGMCYHNSKFALLAGMYASLTDGYLTAHEDAQVLIIERIGYVGMPTYGGPIEEKGRLKYIDGCTDSLLVPPVKKGDACLNLLHFPIGTDQTMHTHPSIRVGVVANGVGECITPFGNVELRPGMVFIIHPENGNNAIGLDGEAHKVGSHCFRTLHSTMQVVAFHPNSDFGPTDEEHPMLNMTFVEGLSAKNIDSIRTK